MDEKGYTFTPLAFLLIIPVVIIAISYSNISNEINMISQIAVGGDITYSTANNIITTIEKSAKDAGRYAAYNATRQVIDNEAMRMDNPFLADSRTYIKEIIASGLNNNTIETCKKLETETGRKIYINNKDINNQTTAVFTVNDIEIDHIDKFGLKVKVKSGIPITVVQNDQNFTGYTPKDITVYVSITGLEDPYIWVNTNDRRSTVIDKYPYYTSYNNEFHFDDSWNSTGLFKMWDCLNGTNNTSKIALRPYYFPDPSGLTFFDRLENKNNNSSPGPNSAKMSTFVLGDPLREQYFPTNVSCVDHEYFSKTVGHPITVDGVIFDDPWPGPSPVYLSPKYINYFQLRSDGIY